ncbi:hypothetical protein OG522_07995 [Streptomyces sp. NBC_01431]
MGARTDRDTWVRIERREAAKIRAQGWNGSECAAQLTGIAQPTWHAGVVWREANASVFWRADETDLLPGVPVGSSVVAEDPKLPDAWWHSLNVSLDTLAAQHTRRIATRNTEAITQDLDTTIVRAAFPEVLNTTVNQWRPAHADLNWANVTLPKFSLFGWEDWGIAPRGLDSATLWASSLAVPTLADRVLSERRHDFETRDGQLMTLFVCAKLLGPHSHPHDPRLGPAHATASKVIKSLSSP